MNDVVNNMTNQPGQKPDPKQGSCQALIQRENKPRSWKELTKPGVCIEVIIFAQSCKVDAMIWDIKGIAKHWAIHLHLHAVPTRPPLALPRSLNKCWSPVTPNPSTSDNLAPSVWFLETDTRTLSFSSFTAFGQNASSEMLFFILLLTSKAKEILPLLTFACSKLS